MTAPSPEPHAGTTPLGHIRMELEDDEDNRGQYYDVTASGNMSELNCFHDFSTIL